MAEVQQDEQDPQYQFFLYLFLSEEALEVQVTNDSSITNVDEVVRQDPMLERFVGYKDDITKPRFIDMGRQGFVFRFKYREQDLCLKVFYPYKAPYNVHKEVEAFISPFGCESRAFARLCDLRENGHWAVRCHGWMYLKDSQLQQLRRVCGRRVGNDPYWDNARWAIVKDFIADKPPSRQDEQFQNILSKFCIPKRGGILPDDVKKENYRGDRIVDLGSTITFPFYRRYAQAEDLDRFFKELDQYELPEWDNSNE
ncbi:hypothetical protein COH20_005840 [Aspergillus flavus]|nr:hypothetical protein COH20_005840 [Aspergillus flavus]RAQ81341.1 hypothetical protein COH21_011343 [Aspergillus flavus]